MKKRVLALILATVFVVMMLAACSPSTPTTDPGTNDPGTADPGTTTTDPGTTTTDPATTPDDVQTTAGEKVYRTYMASDCATMNSHDIADSNLQTPYNYCSSPLYRAYPSDEEGGLGYTYIPDLAAELPIQIDDYTWQIKLREDAKWNDGTPINADTLIYTYQQFIDPIMLNQMRDFFCNYNIHIVGAVEYAAQGDTNTVSWDEVGFQKIDDYTVEIKTVDVNAWTDVCNHFTDRSMFPVYEPYYEAGMDDTRTSTSYGSTLDNWMGCGPYFFDTWTTDSIQVYVKNPDHWLADYFNFDRVEVRIVPEMNARVELWEKGLLDDLTPDVNTIETYLDDPRLVDYPSLYVLHVDLNSINPNNPLDGGANVNFRKAMYHAFDRETIASHCFGYQKPAGFYVNELAGITSSTGETYRDSSYGTAVTDMIAGWSADGHTTGYNPELAYEYLMKAYEECGVSEDTVIHLIWACDNDSTGWKATGEYLMEEFKSIFQGKVELEMVPYAGMSATEFKATGDDKWDFSPNDWGRGVSRTYPYTCFYYYISDYSGPNNFHVKEFDDQFAACEEIDRDDYEAILQGTKTLEEIYLDYVIHIPVVQEVSYSMFSDDLKLPVSRYIPGFGWGTMWADKTPDA